MKTTHYFIAALSLLVLVHCKSTKPVAISKPAPAPAVVISTPGSDATIPTQLQAAEKRWPGTSEMDLDQGQVIFTTKCIRCHKAFAIEGFSEAKWLHEIDDMSPKAHLTEDEKQKLTKYILSYHDLKDRVKHN
jgi:mono/diheme cytochrome c family protein